ncbi:thiol-disulfide oxidoreductase DCC family protein [Rhabdobacter roseus]|uniref:Putative DCC family thiol-disulfide oxidoreductase YuxK n=1 Tax=Rhabdobacter roseus TaxID=1655419 RepID=A0A840TQ66_9BACT|nr:thiol-disulfide oxidoreductase DCC family protein [Rhabdobacter roseus]MBB5282158.1 putative DCC family thiol-disulfide oxidoreductase YuxK [Rhabdobacter roseus]
MKVVLFDGVCNLCNGAVNFLIEHDKEQQLQFASLQSDFGQEVLRRHGLSTQAYESFLFLEGNRLFQRSEAALAVLRYLGWPWKVLLVFRIVPRFVRDALYTWVARHRYAWFGKREACRLPTPSLRARFL